MGRSPLSDRAADRLAALAAQAATAPTVLVQLIDGTGLRLAGGVGLPSAWQEMRALDHAAQACAALVAKQLARQEVDRQRGFLDAVLDSLNVGVIACDGEGRVTRLNPAVRALSGDPPADGRVDTWARELIPYDADGQPLPPEDVPLLRALRGERVRDVELVLIGP